MLGARTLTLYPNELRGAIDVTAEPTQEVLAGTNSFNQAVAAGDQVSEPLDVDRSAALTITTGGSSSKPRIDMALTKRVKPDFVLVDGLNLLDAYPAAMSRQVGLYQGSTGTFGSATAIAVNSYVAGLLAKGRGFLRFDGVDDVVNNDNDPVGAYPFTMAGWFRTTAAATGTVVYIGDKSTDNVYYEFEVTAAGLPNLIARNTGARQATGTTAVNDGNWHHFAGIFTDSTDRELYIAGVSVATNTETAAFAAGTDRISLGALNRASPVQYFDGDIKNIKIYNRVLAPKEIAQMAKGYPVPKPLIVGDNSSMNSTGDWTISSGGIITGGYDSGDSGHSTTLRLEASTTNERGELAQAVVPTVAGRIYLLTFDYKFITMYTASGSDLTVQVGGTSLTPLDIDLATGTWYSYSEQVIAADASTPLRIYVNAGASGGNSNEILIDNAYLTDLDTLVAFPLVVDQRGKVYISDFSAGVDNWTAARGTVAGNIDGIGGQNDNLRFTVDSTFGNHSADGPTNTIVIGDRVRISFDFYIPSGQAKIGSVIMGGALSLPFDNTTDAWTTLTAEGIAAAVNLKVFAASSGGSSNFSGNGTDVFYIRNVRIDILGAVVVYQPDGFSPAQGKALDASDNDLHGTQSGGVEFHDCPEGDDKGFLLQKFTALDIANLFVQYNEQGETGIAGKNLDLTQICSGESMTLNVIFPDDNVARPGIDLLEAHGGAETSSERYGGRRWIREPIANGLTDAQKERLEEIEEAQEWIEWPFYVGVPDPDTGIEVLRCVRFGGAIKIKRTGGKWSAQIPLKEVAMP